MLLRSAGLQVKEKQSSLQQSSFCFSQHRAHPNPSCLALGEDAGGLGARPPTCWPPALCRVQDLGAAPAAGTEQRVPVLRRGSSLTNLRPATARNMVLSLNRNCCVCEEETIHSWVERSTKPSSSEQVPVEGCCEGDGSAKAVLASVTAQG